MSRRLKKILSVFFAILIGAGIIFFAWRGDVSTYTKNEEVENTTDWKSALSVVPAISPLKTLGFSRSATTGINTATTTTGIIARDILVEYAFTQFNASSTTLSNIEIEAIAQTLAERAKSTSPVKIYAKKNLIVVPESDSSTQEYRKKVSQAFAIFEKEHSVDELSLIIKFAQTKDASLLTPLSASAPLYKNLINNLLAIPVPSPFAPFHLLLLKTYATLLSGIEDTAQMAVDPVRGMNGLTTYREGTNLLIQINKVLGIQ